MCDHNKENWDCPNCEADKIFLDKEEIARRVGILREEGFKIQAEAMEREAARVQGVAKKTA